jgi:diguanylate cyclase (GGDEF)-like protein
MLVVDDGKLATETGPAAPIAGDAWRDALTGLGNRRHFNEILRETLDDATSENQHAILLLDLDRFAPINDTLGHPVGDALLCVVAQRLRRELRDDDLLVRLGGDEFAVMIQNGDSAAAVATRVADILSRPFQVQDHIINIGASVGVVQFPARGATADDLMRHADLALYDAKSAGRRTWRMFEPAMAAQARSRRAFETDLRKALAMGEFSLAYQAQVDVRTKSVTGFEALLRWTHPTRGIVSPVVFIPVAEEIGCIVALGEWVLNAACEAAAQWPAGLSVAVNVSPRQFEDSERLFAAVETALRASGLPPARLELEITESSLLSREAHVLDTLHRLRASGIRIAMDDFGTGYSSLSQLLSFPFDKIKIDRTFIAGLGKNADATAVLRAISAMGSGLGMATTAEGVETEEQAVLVAAHGCTDIQGYLISRPIPASEIDAFLCQYARELEKVAIPA